MWGRGIVPNALIPMHPWPDQDHFWSQGLCNGMFVPLEKDGGGVTLGGDASGGANAQSPRHRRVGVGLAQVPTDSEVRVAALRLNLVGECQEVGLGEETALFMALSRTYCNLVFITDRQSVLDHWNGQVWRTLGPQSGVAHPGIWRDIGREVERRERVVLVIKCESHATDKDIDDGYVTRRHAKINQLADELARTAADLIEVPRKVAQGEKQWRSRSTGALHAQPWLLQIWLEMPLACPGLTVLGSSLPPSQPSEQVGTPLNPHSRGRQS